MGGERVGMTSLNNFLSTVMNKAFKVFIVVGDHYITIGVNYHIFCELIGVRIVIKF